MPSGERAGGKELEIMKSISTQGGRRLGSFASRMPTRLLLEGEQMLYRLILILAARSISRCSREERRESSSVEMIKSIDSEEEESVPPHVVV